jgi:hypothetical protein
MAARIGLYDFYGPKPLIAGACALVASGGVAAVAISDVAFAGGIVFGGVFHVVAILSMGALALSARLCGINIESGAEANFLADVYKITSLALGVILGSTAAVAITTWAGYAITFNMGLGLGVATLVIDGIFGLVLFCYFMANMDYYTQRAHNLNLR